MKKIIFVALAIIGMVAMFTDEANATGYKRSMTTLKTVGGFTMLTGTGTFVAATDTFYFPIVIDRRSMYFMDTLMQVFNLLITPASDTSNVDWEVWTTSDTTNWWVAANAAFNSKIWNVTSVGRDSVASGKVTRIVQAGITTYKGWQPYVMIVGIGKAALSNGKANEIGNVLRVDAIKP